MSFSSDIKKEVIRMDRGKQCCILAEIAGFVRMSGQIKTLDGGPVLVLATENPATARFFLKLIKDHIDAKVSLTINQSKVLKKNRIYELLVESPDIEERFNQQDKGIPEEVKQNKCCKRAYLRGVFLGGGTVSHPEKSYHMEIVCSNENLAEDIMALINSFGLKSKISSRRNNYIVYLKESEQISDFLALLGASNQVLKFENIRIIKELRNKTNRIVNCESANMDKTIDSAVRQIEAIRRIDRSLGIDNLPIKLKETAELRLENPESSLAELGELMEPPLKKSGVSHRFRRLEEIADKLPK